MVWLQVKRMKRWRSSSKNILEMLPRKTHWNLHFQYKRQCVLCIHLRNLSVNCLIIGLCIRIERLIESKQLFLRILNHQNLNHKKRLITKLVLDHKMIKFSHTPHVTTLTPSPEPRFRKTTPLMTRRKKTTVTCKVGDERGRDSSLSRNLDSSLSMEGTWSPDPNKYTIQPHMVSSVQLASPSPVTTTRRPTPSKATISSMLLPCPSSSFTTDLSPRSQKKLSTLRLRQLHERNRNLPPHLRSSYVVEELPGLEVDLLAEEAIRPGDDDSDEENQMRMIWSDFICKFDHLIELSNNFFHSNKYSYICSLYFAFVGLLFSSSSYTTS